MFCGTAAGGPDLLYRGSKGRNEFPRLSAVFLIGMLGGFFKAGAAFVRHGVGVVGHFLHHGHHRRVNAALTQE